MPADEVLISRDAVVAIHLDRLAELVACEQPTASEALQASLSLRFLFDGALNKAAIAHGEQLMIPTPDTQNIPIGEAMLFVCGGYERGGMKVRPYYLYREPGLNSPHRARFEGQAAASPATIPIASQKLGLFQRSSCLSLMGKVHAREDLIRYVANKCGGAHHSDSLESFKEWDLQLTSLGHMLCSDEDLSAIFLEAIGVGWFLLQSASVQTLRSKIKTAS